MQRSCFKTFVVCLILILFASCEATKESVPGQYYERFDWGEVTLDLRKNGTFVEEATLSDGTKKRVEGNWTFVVRDGDSRVERGPCLSLGYERLEKETYEFCGQSIKSILGVLEISLDPDHGYAYGKRR